MTTNITLTLTDRHISALCSTYGYAAIDPLTGKPNPQSQSDFALSQVENFVQNIAQSVDVIAAISSAETTAIQQAQNQPKPIGVIS